MNDKIKDDSPFNGGGSQPNKKGDKQKSKSLTYGLIIVAVIIVALTVIAIFG